MAYTLILYLTITSLLSASALQIPLQASPLAPSSSPSYAAAASADHSSFLPTLPKPSSPLQWGTLNILSLTDTHGWLRGHTHLRNIPEASYSASIADVYSFKEHLCNKARELGVDVLLVDSGDTVDGNGFVDADTSGVKGRMARRILGQIGIDIATTGNHELYNYTVAHDVYKSYIPTFGGHYLSSNININITLPTSTSSSSTSATSSVPFGSRYLQFRTQNQNLSITAFGILFGFDRADTGLKVQSVFDLIQESWWREVLENSHDTDVFIVLGHMATRDKDWLLVLNSIRTYYPTKPVLIFSGHAHVRDCIRPDPYSQVLASGRYMETLGFTSITLPSSSSSPLLNEQNQHAPTSRHPFYTSLTAEQAHNPLQITRRYIDNNLASYMYHANKSTLEAFHRVKGRELQNEMNQYAKNFNLSFTFGTAPQSYYLDRYPITHPKSLIKLYADEVFNTVVVRRKRKSKLQDAISNEDPSTSVRESGKTKKKKKEKKPVFLFNTGGARFNIFKGNFTRDDQFTVIPFDNEIWSLQNELDHDLIIALVEWLNNLWGEPELVELALSKVDKMSVHVGGVEDYTQERVQWNRENEIILRDSIAVSARRREASNAYLEFLAEESASADEDSEGTAAFEGAEEADGLPLSDKQELLKTHKSGKKLTFGYVTKDKCGPYRGEGDDTKHRPLPAYPIPEFVLSTRPEEDNHGRSTEDNHDGEGGGDKAYERVHLVFYEFIAPLVITGLNKLQSQQTFSYSNLTKYSDLKANELLGEYAKIAWN
ncbi:Metallo-dependent phosphatase [Cystobasidium minutum MCA 4210]|uniref:Metallo-dependent phosphatase n=1 Tax=Cystobasidium minutum MCA 4210 TaxID=1397322 RepID=UPI0034CE54E6|eukprot:jgi/Rhomi1/167227/fgenesh1_kg.2_\